MEMSDELIRVCTRRVLLSRMRLLYSNGFYGLLLMHARMAIGDKHETAWVEDGDKITFNPGFLKGLSDMEIDYVMMHEILHIVLDHLGRMKVLGKDTFVYNVAADIVVNSNILRSCGGNTQFISLEAYGGEQMHKAPDGSEGWMHTVEEIYEMLQTEKNELGDGEGKSRREWDFHLHEELSDGGGDEGSGKVSGKESDRSSRKEKESVSQSKAKREFWKACVLQAAEALSSGRILEDSISCGNIPVLAERIIEEIKRPQTDWRTVLDEFIQEDIVDYSFTPPDRRYGDSPFFLPDFNERDDRIEKVLFMIDTSGSMSDETVTTVYSEVKGAIEQFGGRLEGWLGFFDAEVVEPEAFSNEEEFEVIRPQGGGGTSFSAVFEYVNEKMAGEDIMSIVILTDGIADFPNESVIHGTPVLWIITNESITPPWGKVARVKA